MNSELGEWRPVVGYEGLYEVSSLGEVRSLERTDSIGRLRNGVIKHPSKIKTGHCSVQLCKDGIIKTNWLHRLVAQAFIPNHDNLPCVNHKDEDPTNNRVENLEWCTQEYNCNYGTRNEKISKALTNCETTSKPVLQLTIEGWIFKEWPSFMEINRSLGYNIQNINQCCIGLRKTAYGFRWEYK